MQQGDVEQGYESDVEREEEALRAAETDAAMGMIDMEELERRRQNKAEKAMKEVWAEQNTWMDNYRTAEEYHPYMDALERGEVEGQGRVLT